MVLTADHRDWLFPPLTKEQEGGVPVLLEDKGGMKKITPSQVLVRLSPIGHLLSTDLADLPPGHLSWG